MGEQRRTIRALSAILLALILAAVPAAAAARPHAHTALKRFRPRIGAALGLLPLHGQQTASGAVTTPLVYHGGTVMHGVTVHTIYWAPPGFAFGGAPSETAGDYRSVIDGFLRDTAADSGRSSNVFSLLGQYPDRAGVGGYGIHFDPAADSVLDTAPYPGSGHGCLSAAGAAVCVSDAELQSEIRRVIRTTAPSATGLHDVWIILLPPGVDTCLTLGSCATSAYAGYHALFDTAGGPVIYAAIPDPQVELVTPPGSDPQGNPDAEAAVDVIAHEVMEAMTDPEGAGWMDPNGFEVGDRCETGPQIGSPLGYAPNGSPYNQLIAGHQYLLQAMWSNRDSGCVDRSSVVTPPVQLPAATLTQYSATLAGRDPSGRPGQLVRALLIRAGDIAGLGQTRTGANGHWRLSLQDPAGNPAAVGDDREDLLLSVNGHVLLIQPGDGGDPFTAAGWTGWFDLDHGFAVGRSMVSLAPCSQTGVLVLRRQGRPVGAPLDQCGTASGVATISTGPLTPATALTLDSEDNRASSFAYPAGALVTMRVTLGEPGAVAAVGNPAITLPITGVAACHADLYQESVRCSGLVRGERYRLVRRRGARSATARADSNGVASFATRLGLLTGGDLLTLYGTGHRALTALHVARLRVDAAAGRTTATGGHCEPDQYVGGPIALPPVGASIGTPGVSETGRVCPGWASATGLPMRGLVQTDQFSGGTTRTEVPDILGTVPAQDATLYGRFRVLAQAGFSAAGAHTRDGVSVRITRAGSGRVVFSARNVDTPSGRFLAGLPSGSYTATWVLHDRNGDTRTLRTVFIEA